MYASPIATPPSTRRAVRNGRLARPAPHSRAGEPLVRAAEGAATNELYGGGDGDGLEQQSMPKPLRDCLPSRIGAVTPSSVHSRTSWSTLALSEPVTAKQS